MSRELYALKTNVCVFNVRLNTRTSIYCSCDNSSNMFTTQQKETCQFIICLVLRFMWNPAAMSSLRFVSTFLDCPSVRPPVGLSVLLDPEGYKVPMSVYSERFLSLIVPVYSLAYHPVVGNCS